MSTLTGGKVWDTHRGVWADWKPVGPVVDEWLFYTKRADDGYVCLGVVGNRAHWNVVNGQDHTSRSRQSTIINGVTVWPLPGWVYAIDGRVPEPARFEAWLLAKRRAGHFLHLKYFNILGRHWNLKTGFRTATKSGDEHLHMSMTPGSERSDSTILAEYEADRTGGGPVLVPVSHPTPAPAAPSGLVERLVATLPTLRKGAKGKAVRKLQGLLCAHGYTTAIDGDFGGGTEAKLRKFQGDKGTPGGVDGVAGGGSWTALVSG